MKCAMILVLLAVSLLVSAENVREKRNVVELLTNGTNPSREEMDYALTKAKAVIEAAMKKVEDPNTNLEEDSGEVKVAVRRDTDADEAKLKRRGLLHVSVGIGKK